MKKILLFSVFFLPFLASAQSPWARNKAGFYIQASYNFIPTYGSLFGKDGEDIILDHEVTERQFQLYGEFGITKRTTLVATIPYVSNVRGADNPDSPWLFAIETTGKINGLGNVNVAVRHQFLMGKIAVAGTLAVGLPAAADYKPYSDLRTGYPALTIHPTVNAGIGLKKAYAFAFAGYGYRNKGYSHFLHFGAEAGLHAGPIWIAAFSDIVNSLRNGDQHLAPLDARTGLYTNDQGWLSIGFKAIWEINRFAGIGLSGAGAAWAQNVPKSPGIGAFAYFKWD